MHLNRKLLSTLFLTSLLENTQLVSCARIPSRISELTQREANTPLVSLPDFGSISEYVCPTGLTDSWKRQSSGSGITVPKNQLNNLLLQIQLIELQISTLMLAEDGLLPANPSALASPGPTTATSTPLASPSTAANSSLETTALACSFNASTTTVKVTETVFMTVNVTVAPSSIVQSVAASSTTIVPSSSLALNETTVAVINTSTSVQAASDTSLPGSSAAAPTSNGSIFPEPQTPAAMPTAAAGSPIPAPTSSGPAAASSTPVAASSAPAAASSTAVVGFTGAVPPASNQVSSRYTFNAASSKNIAVYFGQTPVTGGTTLEAQCADPSIDIVILAFVIAQLDGGGLYPAVNFGAACSGQTAKMASEAPGLLSCPDLAANILTCQNTYGKKVFLSIGGAASQISFSSESEASTFGDVLWNLFGPPGNVEYSELRPFGTVEIDGFDVGSYPLSHFRFPLLRSIINVGWKRQRGQLALPLRHPWLHPPHALRNRIKTLLPLICTSMPLPRCFGSPCPPSPLRFRLGPILQQPALRNRLRRF